MSNIDKQALREAAEKATKGQWQFHDRQSLSHSGSGFVAIAGKEAILCFNAPVGGINQSNNVVKYIAAANPATVLALLDELEAKDRKILKLEKLAEAESVGADKAATSGVEWMKLYHAAEKRIAELERKEQHSERQSVIDALAGSGEEWSDIEEYMQKWDAERASADGKGE